MPRDDLSIDFVKKMGSSIEAQDPQFILEDWVHRSQNLPDEIRFLQDEIADKDRSYNDCVKTIEENDGKIQKWIRANGSHQPNPRENQLREVIRENFNRADLLAVEKVALAQRMQRLYDKHLRHLDVQIKLLSDRAEPGFTEPDEIPSLLRPSAANHSNTSVKVLGVSGNTPLNPILNNATPTGTRLPHPSQIRNSQNQAAVSASAPATPTATILLNRSQREGSAGPGSSSAPKRGPRSNSGLGTLPAAPSGLARHSSLGPGTPKAGTPTGAGRAGSAGPRQGPKTAATSRKTTPVGGVGRKKPPTSKSTLSRVKRAANSRGSPASTADSELSDADSATSSRAGSRAGSGTPVPSNSSQREGKNNGATPATPAAALTTTITTTADADGDESMMDRDADPASGSEHGTAEEDDDDDDDDEEEDEEGKKYCLCQHVSYGDMVACDNDDCPYEWFHWNCVGLKSEPQGRWFCPACTEARNKKASIPPK